MGHNPLEWLAELGKSDMRDTQRAKLYKAEKVLEPFAKPVPSVKDVDRYCRALFKRGRVEAAWPRAAKWRQQKPLVIGDGRGARCAQSFGGRISIPLWARKDTIIIHECAHEIIRREVRGDYASHGWEYAECFLKLVLYCMGREAHDALKASYKACRVRFTEPRKRAPLSPEKRAELGARLAMARAAKESQK